MAADARGPQLCEERVQVDVPECRAGDRALPRPIGDTQGAAAACLAPPYPGHLFLIAVSEDPDDDSGHAAVQQPPKQNVEFSKIKGLCAVEDHSHRPATLP